MIIVQALCYDVTGSKASFYILFSSIQLCDLAPKKTKKNNKKTEYK